MNSLLSHETLIRLSAFGTVFFVMACWELVAPCRQLSTSKTRRWFNNLSIVIINTLLLRLIFPGAAVGMALLAGERHWGLLNNYPLPDGIALILAVIVLDLAIYLQHVMFHAVPALWQLHMVHHTDLDFDVTTGTRFHPVEIILSMLIKFSVISVLGASAAAVLIFEVLLNATAMFNHSNVTLPAGLDRLLRLIIVTPDMHRVHHSVIKDETNSNFGFNLPWWDRLLGTYRPQPTGGQRGMTIGLRPFRDPAQLTLPKMLLLPFTTRAADYPLNRDNDH